MSRRRSSKQDSLELLLDTICNTFGGVLFIAILVVLLLQQTGTAPASVTSVPVRTVSDEELRTIQSRWENVSADLERLRSNRDSQTEVARQFAPDELRQLLSTRNDVREQQESLQRNIDQQLSENLKLSADVEKLTRENAAVRTRREASQTRLQVVRSQWDESRRARVQEVRMPVLRDAPFKREVGVVLRYGRLYVWHRYGPGGERRGLNTDDFTVVGKESGGLVVHPIPTSGVVLDDSEVSRATVRQRLSAFSADRCYLTVVARPDSYQVFRHVRDVAIELGLEYRLMAADADGAIADRGGTGGKVQ